MIFNDYALNWSYNFQDPGAKAMYEIIDLHDQIIFYLIIIFAVVAYFM
jgi:heme/copper-type cytochrome/quinol oxidase subunit 2